VPQVSSAAAGETWETTNVNRKLRTRPATEIDLKWNGLRRLPPAMRPYIQDDRATFVSQCDSEALLHAIAAQVHNPRGGIFGPDSVTWKINRESALFLGAGRAAILQLAHPWVATALQQHSSLLARPIARFHNTFRIVFTMVFGTLDQALRAARHLHALHAGIRGEMTEEVGVYKRSSHYEASEIGALRWVFATLVESAVLAYECALPPLAPQEREAYYAESKILAGLFGIPASALPADWDAFATCIRTMAASDSLGVSSVARSMAHNLLSGAGSWIHPPRWYRALTAMWLPERFRTEFGLDFDAADRRAAERALRRLPMVYRRLPALIRFVGPWREARACLQNRRSGALVKLSNRFWIGQSRLPFADG
jgi:uncharacterized protein (DUF2236 family)